MHFKYAFPKILLCPCISVIISGKIFSIHIWCMIQFSLINKMKGEKPFKFSVIFWSGSGFLFKVWSQDTSKSKWVGKTDNLISFLASRGKEDGGREAVVFTAPVILFLNSCCVLLSISPIVPWHIIFFTYSRFFSGFIQGILQFNDMSESCVFWKGMYITLICWDPCTFLNKY